MSRRYVLSRLEYDFCWEHLKLGPYPTVLDMRSHGATTDERAVLARQVWRSLEAKGLVERPGELDHDLEGCLLVLARPQWEVDARLRLDRHGPRLKALTAAHGDVAVSAVLDQENLMLEVIHTSAMARSVVALLPQHPAGRGRSVTLPAEVLDRAAAYAGEDTAALERALAAEGVAPPDAHKVADVLGDVVRMGQFGVAHTERRPAWPARRERASHAVSFYDTSDGRYQFSRRPSGDRREWCTLSSTDNQRLTHQVAELLSEFTDH